MPWDYRLELCFVMVPMQVDLLHEEYVEIS